MEAYATTTGALHLENPIPLIKQSAFHHSKMSYSLLGISCEHVESDSAACSACIGLLLETHTGLGFRGLGV